MPYQDFNLAPSRQFIILIILLCAGSTVICCYLPLHYAVKLLLLFIVIAYSGWLLWRYGLLKGRQVIIQLRCYTNGQWQLYKNHHVLNNVLLSGDSTVTRGGCVLQFVVPGKRWKLSCVVFHDALQQDQYRRLIVKTRLRFI